MEQTCCITGQTVPENEGLSWQQLRPSLQDFLISIRSDWREDSFISYNALNDLLRAYVASKTAEEIKAHKELADKVHQQFAEDDALKPLDMLVEDKPLTFGERMADRIADFGGSWKFIGLFFGFLFIWMVINSLFLKDESFDPYPYILLNLMLSCLAALQAPVIMMSQNRQEYKDRAHAEYDFRVNVKAETEIRMLHEKLDHLLVHQHQAMVELFQLQLDMMQMVQQRIDGFKPPAEK